MKGKYLITTNEWFYAPDGKQYRAVWGDVEVMHIFDVLGIEPNRVTANWTLRVGTEEEHIIIGGCQINYSVKCENKPNIKAVEQIIQGEKKVDIPAIYIPGDKKEIKIKHLSAGVDDVGIGERKFREIMIDTLTRLEFKSEFRMEFLIRDLDAGMIGSYDIIEDESEPEGLGLVLVLNFKDPGRFKAEIPCRIKQF